MGGFALRRMELCVSHTLPQYDGMAVTLGHVRELLGDRGSPVGTPGPEAQHGDVQWVLGFASFSLQVF